MQKKGQQCLFQCRGRGRPPPPHTHTVCFLGAQHRPLSRQTEGSGAVCRWLSRSWVAGAGGRGTAGSGGAACCEATRDPARGDLCFQRPSPLTQEQPPPANASVPGARTCCRRHRLAVASSARCSLPQLRTKTHQALGSLWPPCCPLRPPPPPWGTRTGSLTLQWKDIFTHAAYSSLKKKILRGKTVFKSLPEQGESMRVLGEQMKARSLLRSLSAQGGRCQALRRRQQRVPISASPITPPSVRPPRAQGR